MAMIANDRWSFRLSYLGTTYLYSLHSKLKYLYLDLVSHYAKIIELFSNSGIIL